MNALAPIILLLLSGDVQVYDEGSEVSPPPICIDDKHRSFGVIESIVDAIIPCEELSDEERK